MKKYLFSIIIALISAMDINAQDVLNFYQTFTGPPPVADNQSATYHFSQDIYIPSYSTNTYTGEYEIWLDRFLWWTNFGYTLSYQYEIVSFPFTMDCAFISGGCGYTCPDANYSDERILTMPGISTSYNSSSDTPSRPRLTGCICVRDEDVLLVKKINNHS